MLRWLGDRLWALCLSGARDRRGAISPLMALMIIPIAGATAMATEVGQWYYFQRALQNAADSAAIAAATNNSSTGSTYLNEARGAARGFGFVDGQSNTTVTANVVTCPAGAGSGATCYQALLTKTVPVGLAGIVGFVGDKGGGKQGIMASAIASTGPGGTGGKQACVWSLGPGNSFTSNGGPKPDLSGCSILSNGNATCNGHNLGADYGLAVGTASGCGKTQISGVTAPTDTYAPLASNIPPNNCSSYPTVPSKKKDPPLPASNVLTGAQTINQSFCGDVQLSGDVTLSGSNTVTIFNGTLDLNGHTFKTASGASATVIFSGTNDASSVRGPSDSGTLDISAPSSGTWSGVAIYQDPRMSPPASSLNISYSGNQPTWNISGLVYLPKSNVTFSGAVNKSGSGTACFVLVAYTILVNGTGNIFANNTACGTSGLTPPTVGGGTVVRLVQ
ncbi:MULTISPECIES: pilus assembly protein TadG-related protein [unclassified Sphingomonas]|uniref:pilus assembly protein TadG-related protein n=1 Tax=unclassified Sphingomonas TaxID=196159 RepID=UPI000927FE7B|nr:MULTISPECIES: pilus assembly protein TadG-related protein [unclassified Sphingomonas]MBN8848539.1 hypothetical protein [Sphingomonas sp.]OJV30691.1 MAG: hypothetical protein BGO24_08235 [Sphingomonas sp. 67-36]